MSTERESRLSNLLDSAKRVARLAELVESADAETPEHVPKLAIGCVELALKNVRIAIKSVSRNGRNHELLEQAGTNLVAVRRSLRAGLRRADQSIGADR